MLLKTFLPATFSIIYKTQPLISTFNNKTQPFITSLNHATQSRLFSSAMTSPIPGKSCPDKSKPGRSKLTEEERDANLTALITSGWTSVEDRDAIRLEYFEYIH